MSEAEILKLVVTQGPWAVVFVALLFWVMKQAAKREERLMQFQVEVGRVLADVAAKLDSVCRTLGSIEERVLQRRD